MRFENIIPTIDHMGKNRYSTLSLSLHFQIRHVDIISTCNEYKQEITAYENEEHFIEAKSCNGTSFKTVDIYLLTKNQVMAFLIYTDAGGVMVDRAKKELFKKIWRYYNHG